MKRDYGTRNAKHEETKEAEKRPITARMQNPTSNYNTCREGGGCPAYRLKLPTGKSHRSTSPNTMSIALSTAVVSASMWPFIIKSIA
jgi:hypothetical protein